MSVSKAAADRNQRTLLELATLPGNDICADCKARNPRWASHNLGIFICVHCASIHRKIGTHITKVKSLTMDSWTKEQVEQMKQMGNVKSNAIYNNNEVRHPPPPQTLDPERDSEMEKYIRAKYEYKRFLDKHAIVASKLGPSRSAASVRATTPTSRGSTPQPRSVSAAGPSTSAAPARAATLAATAASSGPGSVPTRASTAPIQAQAGQQQFQQPGQQYQQPGQQQQQQQQNGVWGDLVQLQGPAQNTTLPLQVMAQPTGLAPNPFGQMQMNGQMQMQAQPTGLAPNPFGQMQQLGGMQQQATGLAPNPFGQMQQQPTGVNPFGPMQMQAQPTGFSMNSQPTGLSMNSQSTGLNP
ncbi:hypothetical protein EV122DRAFT_171095, partial [Schizophyllum commune]